MTSFTKPDVHNISQRRQKRTETRLVVKCFDSLVKFGRAVPGMRSADRPTDREKNKPNFVKKGKGSPYSITERRVPELIAVLGSQPAGEVSHKPGGRLPLLSGGQLDVPTDRLLPPQPLTGLLPIFLLGEQRHDGCEQFA